MKTLFLLGYAFLINSSACDGMYKICYYNYLGQTIAITMKCTGPCPGSINVGD